MIKSKLKYLGYLVVSVFLCGILVFPGLQVSATVPYIAARVDLTSSGTSPASGSVQYESAVSQDGRYVAFDTTANDIISGDTNGQPDVFVRDRKLNTIARVDVSNTGGQLANGANEFRMSANGRFVGFIYKGADIGVGSTNGKFQLYVRDLKNNTTELISTTSSGGLANDTVSSKFEISADGRYVVFSTTSTNIVPNDTNGYSDVFIRDRRLGTTTLLSKTPSGNVGNLSSLRPAISCDGAYVAFLSSASNLVSGDTNGFQDVFLVDRVNNDKISDITINANDYSGSNMEMDISCNGEKLLFTSGASNLVVGDTNNQTDIFAYNIPDGGFNRVNVDSAGNESTGSAPWMSQNSLDFSGRYVVFYSSASNLVSGDTNNATDVFLRDTVDGTTQIISRRHDGSQTTQSSWYPAISLDGRHVVINTDDSSLGALNSGAGAYLAETGI